MQVCLAFQYKQGRVQANWGRGQALGTAPRACVRCPWVGWGRWQQSAGYLCMRTGAVTVLPSWPWLLLCLWALALVTANAAQSSLALLGTPELYLPLLGPRGLGCGHWAREKTVRACGTGQWEVSSRFSPCLTQLLKL